MDLPYLQNYSFHGLSIRIGSTTFDDFQTLDRVLSAFPKTDQTPDWEFYSFREAICPIPDLNSIKPTIKTDMYQFWQKGSVLWIQFEDQAMSRYAQARQSCYAFPMSDQKWSPTTLIHHIFYVALMQRTAKLDWIAVHGAAVSRNGVGILIIAPSGGGKSTLALSLGLAGFSVLSDDRVILRLRSNRSEIISLSEPISVRSNSLSFLPKNIPPIKRESSATCHVLLLPRIVDESHPSLVPISTMEGMQAILNQSTIRLIPGELAGRQFSRLIDWLTGINCYHINLTPELGRVNALVTDLVSIPRCSI